MDNYKKYFQYGLSLDSNVGNSGRSRTVQTQAHIDMIRIKGTGSTPSIKLKHSS